jgi:hypothetical protein
LFAIVGHRDWPGPLLEAELSRKLTALSVRTQEKDVGVFYRSCRWRNSATNITDSSHQIGKGIAMKPSKSISRKNRSRSGKLSLNRLAVEVRRRAVSFKLESLEPRTLLSGSAAANSAVSPSANAVNMTGGQRRKLASGSAGFREGRQHDRDRHRSDDSRCRGDQPHLYRPSDDFRNGPLGDFDVDVNSHNNPR